MIIIKEVGNYMIADVRGTEHEGSYQILEKTIDRPNGETCGVYRNKKDALSSFIKLIKAA